MGLITKIRHRAGLAVGVVAVAMGLFIVGTDIFNSNSTILGKNKTDVGEIDGTKVSNEEYQNMIEEMKYRFTLNTGRNPSEQEMVSIRAQAWEYLIVQIAFTEEYDELGIKVTDEEQVDMVQGANIHPDIQAAFTNPETGQFDKEFLQSYLASFDQLNPQQQSMWYFFEKELGPSRLRLKYENLLIKGTYATELESAKRYMNENNVAEADYLYIPYFSVNDNDIKVEDKDYRNYYNENKEDYKTEATRSVSYVSFPIIPSADDSAYIQDEMYKLKEDLKLADDDSLFARVNSDGENYFGSLTINDMPNILQKNVGNLTIGDVRGPYFVDNFYTLYKLNDVVQGTENDYVAKASHILIKWDDETDAAKSRARTEANRVLRDVRSGKDFAEVAREKSQDPGSARLGGDLGWFGKGRMVPPFEEAVFGASRKGVVNKVVESDFGFHIIKIDEVPTNTMYKVATVQREILASDVTINEAFRKADLFASQSSGYSDFISNAEADSIEVSDADQLKQNDRRIGRLGEGREVVRWAFQTDDVGEVSEVFELENNYVVAVLTEKVKEGYSDLEDVKSRMEQKVFNSKKADYIIAKLDSIGEKEDFNALAGAYGADANVYSSSSVKPNDNTLPSVGFAPSAIGTIFGLSDGQISKPVKEENGIVLIKLKAKTQAPEIADYNIYKSQLEQRQTGRISQGVSEVIKEYADIKDFRYRFY